MKNNSHGIASTKDPQQSESIKKAIYDEIIKAIMNLGAKSDLLCTLGSYGDTLSDGEVLDQLRSWNRAHSKPGKES